MILQPETAVVLNKALKGEPVEYGPGKNGLPEWERELLIAVIDADNPMSEYRARVGCRADGPAIDAQVFSADLPAWELGNRKEKSLKSDDYAAAMRTLGYYLAVNEITDSVEINGAPISDLMEHKINARLRDLGLRQINVARDAYISHAAKNSYHPIRRYLENLGDRGAGHIEKLAGYFSDKHNIFPIILRSWLIGAVAKVYSAAQNRVMVLDGVQDAGKSFFANWLVPAGLRERHFVEGPILPDDKDCHLRLIRAWVWEVAELGSTTRRADLDALKFFLTMQQVTVRAPYGRHDLNKPAMASFIGTVNDMAGFLNDPTGSRRFMATTLTRIDWAYAQAISIDDVWAEAYQAYRAGEPWRIEGETKKRIEKINASFEVVDPLADYLITTYDIDPQRREWFIPANTIRERMNALGWKLPSPRAESMAIASELLRLGVTKGRGTDPATSKQVRGFYGVKPRSVPHAP